MRPVILATVMALSAAAGLAMAAPAAQASAVRVGLFDMTTMMPGAVADGGYGMGSYGMGGYGMGGHGMGSMRRGGFAPGMMMGRGGGAGMMGSGGMAIRADRARVKAGEVTFDVTNLSRSLVHELVVVAVDNAEAPLPYDAARQEVIEDQVKVLGEADDLEPNSTKSLTLSLPPGNYRLICNVAGHYAAGMQMAFTVTE